MAILIGGSKGHSSLATPLLVHFFNFMQFSGEIGKIIGSRPRFWDRHPRLGNPGSTTDTACDEEYGGDHSSWTITSKPDKTETKHLHPQVIKQCVVFNQIKA